jgi:hypothetical protein
VIIHLLPPHAAHSREPGTPDHRGGRKREEEKFLYTQAGNPARVETG